MYDPIVGRFASADTVVPSPFSSQAYDRFAYSLNNPIKYTDPDGHFAICATLAAYGVYEIVTSFVAIASTIQLADYLGDLVNEARRTSSKEKRAADQARTEKRKDPNETQDKNTQKHTGDATEAHKDQKNQGSLELGDKINGQQSSNEIFDSSKTEQNLIQKAKDEAQLTLDKDKAKAEPQEKNPESDGEEGQNQESAETTKD